MTSSSSAAVRPDDRSAWCMNSPTFKDHTIYYLPFCAPLTNASTTSSDAPIPTRPTTRTQPPLGARKCLEGATASSSTVAPNATEEGKVNDETSITDASAITPQDTNNTDVVVSGDDESDDIFTTRNVREVPHAEVMALLASDVENAAVVGLDAEWVKDSNTSVVQLAFTSKRAYVLHVHHNLKEVDDGREGESGAVIVTETTTNTTTTTTTTAPTDAAPKGHPAASHRQRHHHGNPSKHPTVPPPAFSLPKPLMDILFDDTIVKAGVNVVNDAKRLSREHAKEGHGDISRLLNVDQFEVFMREVLFPKDYGTSSVSSPLFSSPTSASSSSLAAPSSSSTPTITTAAESDVVGGVKVIKKVTGHGLEALAYKYLDIELGKDITVTISNWEAPILSIDQICYAADDALASLYIAGTMLATKLGPAALNAFQDPSSSNNNAAGTVVENNLTTPSTITSPLAPTTALYLKQVFARLLPKSADQKELCDLINTPGFIVKYDENEAESANSSTTIIGKLSGWNSTHRRPFTSLTIPILPAAEVAYKNASKLMSKIENERKKQLKLIHGAAGVSTAVGEEGGNTVKTMMTSCGINLLDTEAVERIVRARMEEKARRKPQKNMTTTGLGSMTTSERLAMRGVRQDMMGLLDAKQIEEHMRECDAGGSSSATTSYVAQHLPVQKIANSDTSVKVLDMRGAHIFSCDQHKAKWYVEKKQLALPKIMRESLPPLQSGSAALLSNNNGGMLEQGKQVPYEEAASAFRTKFPSINITATTPDVVCDAGDEKNEENDDADDVEIANVPVPEMDSTTATKTTSEAAAMCIAMRKQGIYRYSTIQLLFDPKLKTKLCMNFQMGHCPVGDGCAFAHSLVELKRDNGKLHTDLLKEMGIRMPSSDTPHPACLVGNSTGSGGVAMEKVSRTAMKKMRSDDRKLVLRLCGGSDAAAAAWWAKHEAEGLSGGGIVYQAPLRKSNCEDDDQQEDGKTTTSTTEEAAASALGQQREDSVLSNNDEDDDDEMAVNVINGGSGGPMTTTSPDGAIQMVYRRPVKLLYCSICMSEGDLMTHAVVPPSLRKFLPHPFHAGWSDDFVLVCLQCNPRVRVTYDVEWRRVEHEAFSTADSRAMAAAAAAATASAAPSNEDPDKKKEVDNNDDQAGSAPDMLDSLHEMPPMGLVSQVIRYAQLLLDTAFCAKLPSSRIVAFWTTVVRHYWKLLPHVILYQRLHPVLQQTTDTNGEEGGQAVEGGESDVENGEEEGDDDDATQPAKMGRQMTSGSGTGEDDDAHSLRVVKKGGRRKRAGWVGGRRRLADLSGVVKVNNPNALTLSHVEAALKDAIINPPPVYDDDTEDKKLKKNDSPAPAADVVDTTTDTSKEPDAASSASPSAVLTVDDIVLPPLPITATELYALARLRPKDVHNANIMRMIISKGTPVFHHNGQVVHCDHEAIPECIRKLNTTTTTPSTIMTGVEDGTDQIDEKADENSTLITAATIAATLPPTATNGYNNNAPVVNEGGVNTVEQGRAVEFVMRWRNIFETHFKPSYIPWKPTVSTATTTTAAATTVDNSS